MLTKRIADMLVKKISEVSSTGELRDVFVDILDQELLFLADYIRIPLGYTNWTYSNLTASEKKIFGSSGKLQLVREWINRLGMSALNERTDDNSINSLNVPTVTRRTKLGDSGATQIDVVEDASVSPDHIVLKRRRLPLDIQEHALEVAQLKLRIEIATKRIQDEQAALAVRKSELDTLKDAEGIAKDKLRDACRDYARQLDEK